MVLVGGGTRVPKVQELLLKAVKKYAYLQLYSLLILEYYIVGLSWVEISILMRQLL